YPQLVRLANSRMRGNEATITPTVLVHELYLRITQGTPLSLRDREHFFAAAARAMRWILIEHARARGTAKRGGGQVAVHLDDHLPAGGPALTDLLALDAGLDALEAISPQRRRVVELRCLAGLEFAEIAALLAVSERTVYREWERARAFLQVMPEDEAAPGPCAAGALAGRRRAVRPVAGPGRRRARGMAGGRGRAGPGQAPARATGRRAPRRGGATAPGDGRPGRTPARRLDAGGGDRPGRH